MRLIRRLASRARMTDFHATDFWREALAPVDLGLAGSRAMVTGAAGGIGRAVVRLLAGEGARVTAFDRVRGEDHGGGVRWVAGDVTLEEDVRAAVAVAAGAGPGETGGLDVVVGCAGTSGPIGSTAEQTALDAWERTLAVNLTGQFLLAKYAIPVLRTAAGAGRAPALVFVASDSSLVASPGMTAYCASKGGLLMLTKALAVDHGDEGVRVNCVAPSIVDTPMSRRDLDLGETGFAAAPYPVHTAEDVARAIVLLCSGATGTVNGTALVLDFGRSARSGFPA
jgi:dihydroanticapsin dehydrogenase